MFKYELFKLRKTRGFCALCLLLLAVDILLCGFLCKKDLTPENSEGNIISYSNFNTKYETGLNRIIESAENNMTGLRFENISENTFAYRYQKALYDLYSGLKEERLHQNYTVKGWNFLLSYRIGEILLCIAVIFFSSSIFAVEEKTGMLPLIRSCKYGRLRFAAAKLFTAFCFSTFLVALFKAAEFITIFFVSGMQGASAPLKVLNHYLYTPLNISIFTYYLFILASTVTAITLLMLFCAFLSASTYNAPLTVFSGTVFFGINFFLMKAKYGNPYFPLRMLSFCSAVHEGMSEQRFYAANLFGYPVQYHFLRITVWGVLIPLLFAAVLIMYNRKNVCTVKLESVFKRFPIKLNLTEKLKIRKTNRTKKEKSDRRLRHTSLLYWEIYKIAARRMIAVVPLAAIGIVLVIIGQKPLAIYSEEQYYRSYMMRLEGEWTQEKHDYLLSELEKLDAVIRQKSDYEEKYKNQEISIEEYTDFLNKYDNAQMLKKNHMKVVSKSEYLQEVSKNNTAKAWFVYDTGWIAGLSVNNSIIIIAVVILLFHNVFNCESICGFSSILRCTKRGRTPTAVGKFFAVGLISLILAVVLTAAELITVMKLYEFPSPGAPLYSLEMFKNYTGSMTLYRFVLLVIALKILCTVVLSLAVSALSGIIHNAVAVILISLASCSSADILRIFGVNIFDRCRVSDFIAAIPLLLSSFESGNDYAILIITAAVLFWGTAILCCLTVICWN